MSHERPSSAANGSDRAGSLEPGRRAQYLRRYLSEKGSQCSGRPADKPVDLLIIGGGASGLVAAVAGTRLGLSTLILEKTDRCGHKLALTGGRKCNFSHAENPRAMAGRFESIAPGLLPLLRRFPYQRIIEFFQGLGVTARVVEDGCVWPDDTDGPGLRDRLAAAGGRLLSGIKVTGLEQGPDGWLALTDNGRFKARNLLLATGGASYPHTGSTGDGLALCRELELAVTEWFPALCSLRPSQPVQHLAGNARQQVAMTLLIAGRERCRTTGHFLFAHHYITGSAILNLSGHAARALAEHRPVTLTADWVPDANPDNLRHEFEELRTRHGRRQLANSLASRVSRRFADDLIERCRIPADRLLADLSRAEGDRVVAELKQTRFDIIGTEPIERATVTGGGLRLEEIELATGRVRARLGLHAAGELLDTWAETGGYNLHFAWATGIAVAEAVAGRELR